MTGLYHSSVFHVQLYEAPGTEEYSSSGSSGEEEMMKGEEGRGRGTNQDPNGFAGGMKYILVRVHEKSYLSLLVDCNVLLLFPLYGYR